MTPVRSNLTGEKVCLEGGGWVEGGVEGWTGRSGGGKGCWSMAQSSWMIDGWDGMDKGKGMGEKLEREEN